jgi:class 3 adenylate cyclase/uncharacterized RDD family membrane protein YckC
MLTDIQGYSTTTANASREEVVSLIRRHNQLMRPVIEFYSGTIVKSIGDAFLCTFGSATDAVICAIIIQLLLKEYNNRLKEESHKLNLRVVINSGDVSIEENDIFGNAVNVTARMEALECFPGGSIGISESTYLLMDRNEIVAEKIGPQQLKGIPEPINVFRIPFEKQKLNKLPVQLLTLVEKVANVKGDGQNSDVSDQINEWSQSVSNFLKQTNWGDNINKASKQIGKVQKSLAKTFGQKTILEKNKEHKDASLVARAKSGIIDLIILGILTVSLKIAWWPIQKILFGTPEYTDPGLLELMMSMAFRYPFVLFWLYFVIFWKFRQASPGQIAVGTAVVDESGSFNLSFSVLAKRSLLFLVSNFTLIGTAMVFVGEKKTFYDKVCNTRVVE